MSNVNAIKDVLSEALSTGAVEGAVVHVGDGRGEEFTVSAGESFGETIGDDSVWWLASITKGLVAACALMCVERGQLDLAAPVSVYLPSWAKPRRVRRLARGTQLVPAAPFTTDDPNEWVTEDATRPILVRHLLTMTSGLQTIGVPNPAIPVLAEGDTLESFADAVADAPLDFQPGERWHYSNATAFDVVARLVEVVSGQDFGTFLRANILDPLGMSGTDLGITDRNRTLALPLHPFVATHPMVNGYPCGSAGAFGTAADVGRFARMLLDGGLTSRGSRVLQESTVRAMVTHQIGDLRLAGVNATQYGGLPARTNNGVGFGYGVLTLLDADEAGVPVPEGSFGWDGIGSRRWWAIPARDAVIVMLAEGPQAQALHRAVERAALAT